MSVLIINVIIIIEILAMCYSSLYIINLHVLQHILLCV